LYAVILRHLTVLSANCHLPAATYPKLNVI
jgi:hypothetical protein